MGKKIKLFFLIQKMKTNKQNGKNAKQTVCYLKWYFGGDAQKYQI